MEEKSVGKVIRVTYDTNTKEMILELRIDDDEYKRKILRDFKNSDRLLIKGNDVMTILKKEGG